MGLPQDYWDSRVRLARATGSNHQLGSLIPGVIVVRRSKTRLILSIGMLLYLSCDRLGGSSD